MHAQLLTVGGVTTAHTAAGMNDGIGNSSQTYVLAFNFKYNKSDDWQLITSLTFLLEDQNKQCAFNHSGILYSTRMQKLFQSCFRFYQVWQVCK